MFTKILHGLSSAKITKPGKFRSCQDGYAVKSSLKAEDGVLYPLEKSFFFLPKPPTLITHDMVEFRSNILLVCQEYWLILFGSWNLTYFSFYLLFACRLTMWNLRGMVLEARICIILIFSSDLKVSKNICLETFRGMNIMLFLTSSGWYDCQIMFLQTSLRCWYTDV